MKILSEISVPAHAGVVREKTKAAITEIKNSTYNGADTIDLYMSCLEKATPIFFVI